MNRTIWIVIASGGLTSLAAGPVPAAENGFYFIAGMGRAEENPGRSIGTNVAVGFAPFGSPPFGILHVDPDRVDADTSGVAWSVALGYRLNPYVAAEVEYLDFGTTDVSEHYSFDSPPVPLFPTQLTRNYSSSVTGPSLSVLGTLPVGKGLDVFLRAGVLFADRKVEMPQALGIGETFGNTVWLGGVGVDWSFASRWTIRAEYQQTGKLDTTFLVGDADVDRASLSVMFRL